MIGSYPDRDGSLRHPEKEKRKDGENLENGEVGTDANDSVDADLR